MRIIKLQLHIFHIEEMKKFYRDTLEMDVIREQENAFTLQAGKSQITFIKASDIPFYHFALQTSLDFYQYMYEKLYQKDVLLQNTDGETSMYWKGKQLYFRDPDGNIVEILERDNPYPGEILTNWYDVCEIGLPSENVQSLSSFLAPISNDAISGSDTFRFYGNTRGNFVLVKDGRHWYPTEQPATIHPITVEVEGDHYQVLNHPDLPYTIKIKNKWSSDFPVVQMRIARPTDKLDEIITFYEVGLGLTRVGEFRCHQGYDGVMFGLPTLHYHLEFTSHVDGTPCPAPTQDNLLVFYMPDKEKLNVIRDRLVAMGYKAVPAENSYWDHGGITIEDPDGWRIVLYLSSGL